MSRYVKTGLFQINLVGTYYDQLADQLTKPLPQGDFLLVIDTSFVHSIFFSFFFLFYICTLNKKFPFVIRTWEVDLLCSLAFSHGTFAILSATTYPMNVCCHMKERHF